VLALVLVLVLVLLLALALAPVPVLVLYLIETTRSPKISRKAAQGVSPKIPNKDRPTLCKDRARTRKAVQGLRKDAQGRARSVQGPAQGRAQGPRKDRARTAKGLGRLFLKNIFKKRQPKTKHSNSS
jgi:hypothetical protein